MSWPDNVVFERLAALYRAAEPLLRPYAADIPRWVAAGLSFPEARRVAFAGDAWAYRALLELEHEIARVLAEADESEGVDVLRRMGWQG